MEAVTLPRYTAFATACALLVLATGHAAATSPAPAIEQSVVIDRELGYVTTGIFDKNPEIKEKCLPRDWFCVGPFDPDFDWEIGPTGVLFDFDNTNLTVGHDPKHHFEYGPYAFPTLAWDDLRVCWTGCVLPKPAYARAWANVTITAYVLGAEHDLGTYSTSAVIDDVPLVPRSHCQYARESRC